MSRTPMAPPTARVSPQSRRLRLGDQLREMRQESGRVIQDVARGAGIDRTLLTRIETGQRRVRPDQIMKIVESMGVEQYTERWQELYALARDADTSGWWEGPAFKDMSPRQVLPADIESGASRIRWYDFTLVPGLLQSPAYLRARHDPDINDYPSRDIPVSIRARERRQQEVFKPDGPRIEAVVEEMVIRRLVVPRDAMREQLHHLCDLIDNFAQVDVRVLPAGGELLGVRAPRSPWALYEFAAGDPPAAIVEALTADILLREHAEVAHHERLWRRLHEMALPPDQSRAFVADAAAALAEKAEK